MNIHGQAEVRREGSIRRNGEVLASLGFAFPEHKKGKVVSGISLHEKFV